LVDLKIGEVEGKLLGKFLDGKVKKAEEWIKKLPKETEGSGRRVLFNRDRERGGREGDGGNCGRVGEREIERRKSGFGREVKESRGKNEEKEIKKLSERLALLDQKESSILGYLA